MWNWQLYTDFKLSIFLTNLKYVMFSLYTEILIHIRHFGSSTLTRLKIGSGLKKILKRLWKYFVSVTKDYYAWTLHFDILHPFLICTHSYAFWYTDKILTFYSIFKKCILYSKPHNRNIRKGYNFLKISKLKIIIAK